MHAMIGMYVREHGFSPAPTAYVLHATPLHTGLARSDGNVLSVGARTYDQRSRYTPAGYGENFGRLLAPIIKYGETLR